MFFSFFIADNRCWYFCIT